MASTVIGLFDGPAQAERARAEVMALQIPHADIQVYDQAGFQLAGGTDTSTKGFWESLSQTLGFGPSNQAMHQYQEGVRRGGTVVSVTAEDNRIDAIVDVLNRSGAIDVDQRVAEWQLGGWKIKEPLPEGGQQGKGGGMPAGNLGIKRGCVWVYTIVSTERRVA